MTRASGSTSVMQRRIEPPDSLDYFPTPPWATRAFMARMRAEALIEDQDVIWEPACGEGHMAAVLSETNSVLASDIHPYGFGLVNDFTLPAVPVHAKLGAHCVADWIITNPPFNLAETFARLGLQRARSGVALLVRLSWLESASRHALFEQHPPALVLIHASRVPMVKGRWDPDASTATGYCWVVWMGGTEITRLEWIGPDAKALHHRQSDVDRFCAPAAAPLLEARA
jgi:hypothetical protein